MNEIFDIYNILESLSLVVRVSFYDTEDSIGSAIQKVENILIRSGWSALKEVSIKVTIPLSPYQNDADSELLEALQSLPDRYLSHLSKLESVAFKYSATSDC